LDEKTRIRPSADKNGYKSSYCPENGATCGSAHCPSICFMMWIAAGNILPMTSSVPSGVNIAALCSLQVETIPGANNSAVSPGGC
jgi:hypothetical protein